MLQEKTEIKYKYAYKHLKFKYLITQNVHYMLFTHVTQLTQLRN